MQQHINPYKMFIGSFIPNWLLERKELTSGAKIIYARLAQFAGNKGYCYPCQETLAKEIGISDLKQIRKYINDLIKNRLIEVKRQGLNKPNIYYFLDHEWMRPKLITNSHILDKADTPFPDRGISPSPDKADTPYKENHTRESLEKNHNNNTEQPHAPSDKANEDDVCCRVDDFSSFHSCSNKPGMNPDSGTNKNRQQTIPDTLEKYRSGLKSNDKPPESMQNQTDTRTSNISQETMKQLEKLINWLPEKHIGKLKEKYPTEYLIEKIELTENSNVHNPAGFLISALRENWKPVGNDLPPTPPGYEEYETRIMKEAGYERKKGRWVRISNQ